MKQPGWPHRIGMATLFVWSSHACGQSVDTSMARATIDQPLSMAVQVRGFDWPASRLTPDCLQVQVRQGESGETITPLRIRTIPSGEDGRVLVQISSPRTVSDTVLTGRLSLQCGADFTREFTVLADPPLPSSGTPGKRPQPMTTAPATSPAPAPRPATTRSRPDTASTPVTTTPSITRSDDARPPLEDAEVQRLVSAVTTALSESLGPALAQVGNATPWQDLREDQRQTQARLTALQDRIDRSERDLWRDAVLILGTVASLVLGRLLLRVVQESLMPRLNTTSPTVPARRQRQRLQRRHGTDHFAPEPVSGDPVTPTDVPDVMPMQPTLDQGLMHWSPPDDSAPAAPQDVADNRETSHHWEGADFGHPSLDNVASTDLLQELEPHAADFAIGVAVVLERRLQALPGKCPWILLRLLALYRQMGQPWNHERVAAQLEALYNVRIAGMDMPLDNTPADLDAFPDTLHRIQESWQHGDPTAVLSTLLLKPTAVEVLDQPAFEDTLLLLGIVQQRPSIEPAPLSDSTAHCSPSSPPAPAPAPRDRLLDLLAA